MRKLLLATGCAAVIVCAPVLLEKALPFDSTWSTLLATPGLPGLYVASLAERLGVIEAMDSQGDLTLPATVVMYLGSLFAWFLAVLATTSFVGRKSRPRIG